MAKKLIMITRELVESDLIVTVTPLMWCDFSGSMPQLVDEGLIPKDLKLPVGGASVTWQANGHSFLLHRAKRNKSSDIRQWAHEDFWYLRRFEKDYNPHLSIYDLRIMEKHEEIREIRFSNSAAGRLQWDRFQRAGEDQVFQTFMQRTLQADQPRTYSQRCGY